MRVYRYDVPVDDQEHVVECGPVLHVDCREIGAVTIWAPPDEGVQRRFRVFGTGHEIPDSEPWEHRGTALSPGSPFAQRGALVWHVFERMPF